MTDSPSSLRRYYLLYSLSFLAFILTLGILEQYGMPPRWIGYAFLFLTIILYATIGVMARTSNVAEYYVAGRRIPAVFNGMATGADWMSAASFIGLAGTLYLTGYQGLAYVMGWTGGYVLVALLLAPYLRRFGQYTIPDFLGARYGGNVARLVGVFATVLASFVYVVAQIYGVGVITSRFVGLQFEIGVFVGLAGILVCSFLGGMRAVTWTQVAQYLVLIVAYITPVAMLSYKMTGVPVPQVMYGQVLEKISALEQKISHDPAEIEVRRYLFTELFPALKDVHISHVWGGNLGMARRFQPHMLCDRPHGIALSGGYGGEGVGASHLGGRTLADLILQRDTLEVQQPWVLTAGGLNALKAWEPEPCRWLGYNAVIRSFVYEDQTLANPHAAPWRRGFARGLANVMEGFMQ